MASGLPAVARSPDAGVDLAGHHPVRLTWKALRHAGQRVSHVIDPDRQRPCWNRTARAPSGLVVRESRPRHGGHQHPDAVAVEPGVGGVVGRAGPCRPGRGGRAPRLARRAGAAPDHVLQHAVHDEGVALIDAPVAPGMSARVPRRAQSASSRSCGFGPPGAEEILEVGRFCHAARSSCRPASSCSTDASRVSSASHGLLADLRVARPVHQFTVHGRRTRGDDVRFDRGSRRWRIPHRHGGHVHRA